MSVGRVVVGDVEIVGLSDATVTYPWPLDELFPGVASWEAYRERYPAVFASPTEWRSDNNSYVLRSGGRTILIETGIGPADSPLAAAFQTSGRLLDRLGALGIQPDHIDTVVLSHLHPDHVGWNVRWDADGVHLTFPNAQYIVHRADWEAFHRPEVQERFPFAYVAQTITPLRELGALHLVEGDRHLTEDVVVMHTPGHTPGHLSVMVASRGEQALLLGDVVVHPLQVAEPDRNSAFDMDEDMARATRERLLQRAQGSDLLVAARHLREPGFGHVVTETDRAVWQDAHDGGAIDDRPVG